MVLFYIFLISQVFQAGGFLVTSVDDEDSPTQLRPLQVSTNDDSLISRAVSNALNSEDRDKAREILLCICQTKEKELKEQLKAKDREIWKLVAEKSEIACNAKYVTDLAELAEFLLFIREGLAQYEKQNSDTCPKNEEEFVEKINANLQKAKVNDTEEITKIEKQELQGRSHFMKWTWILLFGDEKKCLSLQKLRNALNNELGRYLWYARQMEDLYAVLCADIRGKSPLYVRVMKKENFHNYVKFFSGEIRQAITHFLDNVY